MIALRQAASVICNMCQSSASPVPVNPQEYNTYAAKTAPQNLGYQFTPRQKRHVEDVHRKAIQMALRDGFIQIKMNNNRAVLENQYHNQPMHGFHLCPNCAGQLKNKTEHKSVAKKSKNTKKKKHKQEQEQMRIQEQKDALSLDN